MLFVRLFVLSDLLPLAILLNNWTVISLPSWQAKNYCQSIRQLQGTSDSDICRFVASVRSVTAKKITLSILSPAFLCKYLKTARTCLTVTLLFMSDLK